jgi:L-arabinose isomerase
MNSQQPVKVGLFGIGLDTYWPQFEGLKENLLGYQKQVNERLQSFGAEVVDAGLADNPILSRSVGDRSCGAKAFLDQWSKAGPAHHCAIGVGHVADTLEKLASLLGSPFRKIT